MQGRAKCAENSGLLSMGMAAPHGGLDPKAENQQLIFSDGKPLFFSLLRSRWHLLDEEQTSEKESKSNHRKRKKKRFKDKVHILLRFTASIEIQVKRAEAILTAAGYDIDALNEQIERDAKKRRLKREKSKR